MAVSIGYNNPATLGLVSASSSQIGFPVTALQNQLGSALSAWRSATDAGEWFRIDLGATYTIGAFGVFRTNLTGGATIRWRLFTGSDYASGLVYDSGTNSAGVMSGFGQSVTVGGGNGRYVQCDISDGSNPDTYLSIPLVFVGPLFSPAIGYSPDSNVAATTGNVPSKSKWGPTVISTYWTARTMSVGLQGIRDSEWTSLQDCDLASRLGRNILLIPDTTSVNINREAVFGTCQFANGIGYSNTSPDLRSASLQVTERL